MHGPETIMLVLPADHLIPDTEAFVACALEAVHHAQKGELVVFGIRPTNPETGFGYIEVAQLGPQTQAALRFVEKPDQQTAQEYLATGRYYWNSGMFCFSAGAILQALREHSPEVLQAAEHTWGHASTHGDASCFDAQAFAQLPDISIDYAVMERARNVTLVPAKFGWSDVGSWPAVAQAIPPDPSGNTLNCARGTEYIGVDTSGTHVHVESHGPKIVATVGIRDLVIVDTPDALLVTHKDAAQKVKSVVDALKARQQSCTQLPAIVHRPWGTYATLKEETGYKVKRITVRSGQSLSLQYHHQRAEHWVVVQGTAIVQIGDLEHLTVPGQYRYIPLKEKHRLTNIGDDELVLIEVQCGSYLGEDDIVRLADKYGRTELPAGK
ncbi:mannose-1-phosphate guanyltransferase [Hylemonella gracilis ATCC 19624]|uniref:mannose-1-phosphate guanylyltransferase n=2 Tax=Hylemonella gracilis TaxID=80880 RepID=F3KSF0_9BURK|nr:mannose-1-phosphate guanyltransferase [Hylemonella gracilis ATCC 19624]